MSDLPTDVVVEYGVFTFPVETEIVGYRSIPIWDSARRVIIAVTHELTVRALLSVDPSQVADGLDSTFAGVRSQLLQPADRLTLKNTAWGSFVINPIGGGAEGISDVNWGPRPEEVSFKHGGYKYAAFLTWRVSFQLNNCINNTRKSNILAWNYALNYAIDQSGYTRRACKGYIAIPQTRATTETRTLSDQADSLREQVVQNNTIPIGFRRESFTWDLSEDKCRLDFSFVDQQLPPNIPPPGVVVAEASHHMRQGKRGLVEFYHTIRASYELTSDRSRQQAWEHFAALFQDRITSANRALPHSVIPIPLSLEMEEPEIYGRKAAAFSLTYAQIFKATAPGAKSSVPAKPSLLVLGNGMWRPAPENDWSKWSQSLVKSSVMVPRGVAGLAFDKSEDALVDLCVGGATSVSQMTGKSDKNTRTLHPPTGRGPNVKVSPWVIETPDPNNSFLEYELVLDVSVLDNTINLKPLPINPVNYNPVQPTDIDPAGYQVDYQGGPCDIVQYRGNPTIVLTLRGRALRAGYQITPPRLLTIGGIKAVPMNEPGYGFRTWLAANLGVPIVAAEWSLRYILPCMPTRPFVAPPNPMLGSITNAAQQDGLGDWAKEITTR